MPRKQPIFVLAGNGSSLSRGCEAILNGTLRILRNAFDNPTFVNANFDFSRRPCIPAQTDTDVIHKPIIMKRWSAKWITKQLLQRTSAKMNETFTFRSIKDCILAGNAVLSIGGDNYTIDYGLPQNFLAMDNYVARLRRPLILWGASVGPFDKSPEFAKQMIEHLRTKVSAFFVREELSREYLLQYKISENVISMADPAFVTDAESLPEDKMGFSLPCEAIGLNISPLMARYVTNGSLAAWISKSVEILRYLRQKFNNPIVLVPHDNRAHTNDHKFMSEILKHLGPDHSGIFLLPDSLTAAQTKWVISQMKCIIAARTHAVIAALSSCVPAVSLGYSIKSEGINGQVFGHTKFLISKENIDKDNIAGTLKEVINSHSNIREYLRNRIPAVRKKAFDAGPILKEILEKL